MRSNAGNNSEGAEDREEQFVKLLLANQRRITTYIAALICTPSDVDDVFQDVSLVLWQKFATFQQGTGFAAWACKIAHFKVLELRRHHKYQHLSEELLEVLAHDCDAALLGNDRQYELLGECVAELGPEQQKLLKVRFAEKATLKSTAETIGHAINTVRKQLNALYKSLFDCVHRKSVEDVSP